MNSSNHPELNGKTVIVLGGTGNLGVEITRSFIQEGAHVIVPSRSAEKLDTLRKGLGDDAERFDGYEGEITSYSGADDFAAYLDEGNIEVDHAVAALGGFFYGKPLWEVTEQEWDQYFLDVIRTHLSGARVLAPRLSSGASYTILNGATANNQPLTGPMNLLGSAQVGLRTALSADLDDKARVNMLALGPVLSRVRPQGPPNALRDSDIGDLCVGIATSSVSGNDINVHSRDHLESIFEALK